MPSAPRRRKRRIHTLRDNLCQRTKERQQQGNDCGVYAQLVLETFQRAPSCPCCLLLKEVEIAAIRQQSGTPVARHQISHPSWYRCATLPCTIASRLSGLRT